MTNIVNGSVNPLKCYTIPEAAELLGIHRTTVYDLIRCHELRATKVKGKKRLRHAEIQRYLDRNTERDEAVNSAGR